MNTMAGCRGLVSGLVAAVAAVMVVGVGLATPASANPPGQEIVSVGSGWNSTSKKITAPCPSGKVASGGGGYPAGSTHVHGRVALDRLEPLAGDGGFVATMWELGDVSDDWAVTTKAVCITQPAGYQVVSATAPVETVSATVSCGTKSVIGVGGRINGGFGDVVLDEVVPSFDLKSVTVRAVSVQGSTRTGWSVTAIAVCANAPAGLELLTASKPFTSDSEQNTDKTCPAGKALYSAGVNIGAGNGQAVLTGVNLSTNLTVRAWANEDVDGYGGVWDITVYAICG